MSQKALIFIPLPYGVEGKGGMESEEAHTYVRETLGREAGGWTEFQHCAGGWVDDDGAVVREEVRMYMAAHDADDARILAREVAGLLAYGTTETVVMAWVVDDDGVHQIAER